MFRRVIRKDIGDALRQKLRDRVLSQGLTVIDRGEIGDVLHDLQESVSPGNACYEIVSLQNSWCDKIPHKLLALAGKLSAPHQFEQIMRPMALGYGGGLPYPVARWMVEAWADALREHLPKTVLNFGETGQDKAAYLALRKPNRPPLDKIDEIVKRKFHVRLARSKLGRREEGFRALGGGWSLGYSFGQAEDGREYLDWSHGHSMTNTEYGRIYEDGQEVDRGSSNG